MSGHARFRLMICTALLFSACSRSSLAPAQNLVPDPSFEAATPAWFNENGAPSYFAAKQKVKGAADGARVLAIEGWDKQGSAVLSPPILLPETVLSATIHVRSFGVSADGSVELALLDRDGKKKLAVFGVAPIDGKGQWVSVQSKGVPIAAAEKEGVLAIMVKGEMRGSRVEVDRVGLFAGSKLPPVVDTAELSWFEAEDMQTNGKSWKPLDPFSGWYHEFPSGRMLDGADAAPHDNAPATYTLQVKHRGTFTLWSRFLRTRGPIHGAFTISLKQGGRVVASKEIADDSDAQYGAAPLTWTFAPLSASLQEGPVEVVLTRPDGGAPWVARKVDLFALTNLAYYVPRIQDVRPEGYVRFTNLGDTPLCLLVGVRKHEGPRYNESRMWTAAGAWLGYSCPVDKRLAKGAVSPWLKVSDLLSPAHGHNNLSLLATTQSHVAGLLSGRLLGQLEFALGSEHRIIKSIAVDQAGPRLLFTVGAEFTSDSILSAADHISKEQTTIDGIASTSRPRAKHLDLSLILALSRELDPPQVLDHELRIIEALGFNGVDWPLTRAQDLRAFYEERGLSHAGLSGPKPTLRDDFRLSETALAKLRTDWANLAHEYGPALDQFERVRLLDEPRGPSYSAIVGAPDAGRSFSSWLRAQGRQPSDLGVKSWVDLSPVGPEQAQSKPRAFYWTAIYRLHALAEVARSIVQAKRAAGFPSRVKAYSNYDPTWGNESFTQAGADPFFMQRNGGFELGWTEDWLGYGASPQQVSDQLAILRAAGSPDHQELGLAVVGADGPPALQRLRFFEGLAAGARHFCSYNYGPYYASIDSWGSRYDVYPYISDALHDFGAIDAALDGTSRHQSAVAILYNRTSAIWAGGNTAMEQDGRYLFWALAHAGYQPDFIPEEDVERGELSRYKALYVVGTHLRARAAAAIARWTAGGGVIFATAGAGSRDEYDRPLELLDPVFGAHSAALSPVVDAGRPKYELRHLSPLGVLQTVPNAGPPSVTFNRLCTSETLVPAPGSRIVLKDEVGAPAGVLHRYGRGTALRVAALPGIAYLNDAIKDPSFDVASYHPTQYRPELRDFIAYAASLAHAERVTSNAPIAEVVRYDAPDRVVLIITNHGAPVPHFELQLQASGITSAYTASGIPITVRPIDRRSVQIAFDLEVADAVVLERRTTSAGIARASAATHLRP